MSVNTQGSFKDLPAVSVASTATALLTDNPYREYAEVYNNSSQVVYVGDGNVTAANGRPLFPGQFFRTTSGSSVYGIVASGTADCRITVVN